MNKEEHDSLIKETDNSYITDPHFDTLVGINESIEPKPARPPSPPNPEEWWTERMQIWIWTFIGIILLVMIIIIIFAADS